MSTTYRLEEIREMSKTKIITQIGECRRKLEELGMDHDSAGAFIATVMNLTIVLREKLQEKE